MRKLYFFPCFVLCISSFAQTTLVTPVTRSPAPIADVQVPVQTSDRAVVFSSVADLPLITRASPTVNVADPPPAVSANPPSVRASAAAPDPAPAPPQPETEFEALVRSSLGHPVPIFGSALFRDVPSTFAPLDHAPVRADYVIGPGDQLLIRAWGSIDLDSRVTVDRSGQIYLPRVGVINVAGLRYDQLEQYLRSSLNQQFRNFALSVNVGQLRSIQIFLLGAVRRPGTYTISSLSTVIDALFASGGPSPSGSMRNILLKRNGKVITDMDLYDLLVHGDKSKDAPLESGDVIYVPPAGPSVAIAGSVHSPGIFELRGPTTLKQALQYAGGLDTVAGSARVTIEGIENRKSREVAEYDLSDAMRQTLRDGDIVHIFPISPRFANAVTLRGAAAEPGLYPWHAGMRISDLIPSRQALITRRYYSRQNAMGLSNQGFSGSASSATPNDFRSNSAAINWDYATVTRLNPATLKTDLISFNLNQAITDPSSPANITLKPSDVVTIFLLSDIPVPVERRSRFVTLSGEVRVPGVYRVENGETLRDLVNRAGGLTPMAYLFGANFTRASTREDESRNLQRAVAAARKNLTARAAKIELNENASSAANKQKSLALEQADIQRLAATQPSGRIVLDIPPNAASLDAIPALPLEDGDVLHIPNRGGVVQVIGAVNNENALIYHRNFRVKDYIAKAGGPTREADLKRIFILRADGSVVGDKHGLERMRLMPGDAIVVPNKTFTFNIMNSITTWAQIVAQFGLGIAAVKVISG